MLLSFLAAMAQEESNNLSRNIRWAKEHRNAIGDPPRRAGYGYRRGKDDNGKLVWKIYEPEAKRVRVAFQMAYRGKDYRTILGALNRLDELVLAYATTIHKAQGSEYPVVVMPILMTHLVMLQRNLIYTGITRAKKLLVIIGSKKALSYAVRNQTVLQRNTRLADRIRLEVKISTQNSSESLDYYWMIVHNNIEY